MSVGTGDNIDLRTLPGMVQWYSPTLLLKTAMRHIISGIFGQFADQRIMQATIDGFAPDVMTGVINRYDYSQRPEFIADNAFWFDYVADLGDGFDSTYAMASLISSNCLDIEGAGQLPGSKLLIMGGDQVYPYPTRTAYRERLETPYAMALPSGREGKARRHLFVLPGNHDWYDGLNSFDHVFCKARFGLAAENRIGGWLCPQHRSYFAIRLPHNWWIWGADIQLSQYLDAGQVLYFRGVAEAMQKDPTEVPKVVLCIAEPSWTVEGRDALHGEGNLDLITDIALDAGARICAVVAGDVHHYSRYKAQDLGINFFTSGGGGAYLAPTHWLRSKLKLPWSTRVHELSLKCKIKDGAETDSATCWPSRTWSRLMSLSVLAFPFRNYGFAVCLGLFYWLMTWFYSGTIVDGRSVRDWLIEGPEKITSFWSIAGLTVLAAINSPVLGLLALLLWIVLVAYADLNGIGKLLLGSAHWLAQVIAMVALYIGLTNLSIYILNFIATDFGVLYIRTGAGTIYSIAQAFLYWAEMVFIGGIGAGLVWGAYLTLCSLVGVHCDQAFSSMSIATYKNFLRFKVEPDKLTIYPIGLRRPPARSSWRYRKQGEDSAGSGPAVVSAQSLKPQLIEGPIEIRVGDVKRREPQLQSS